MRTLNKALALILALVMVLGLGAFSVSADSADTTAAEETTEAKEFSDATDIKYDEAVAVLSTLGIMEGRDDGTFDPKAELNRQEGAVMITRLLGVNPTVGSSYFTDIDNPFYQPYLAYVSNEGIIAGYGDGTFGPYDKLTGVAFAKMLLGALGYDASIEGLVGPMWELSVQKLVRSTGIDDGLSGLDLTAPVTREVAAHMLLNTLQKPLVKYGSQTTVAVNGAVVNIGNSNASYVTDNSLARQTIKGDREVNDGPYVVEFAEEYWKDLRLVAWGEGADAFGRPSKEWTYKNAKIGEFADISDLVGIYTAKLAKNALYELVGQAAYNSVDHNSSCLLSFVNGVLVGVVGAYEDDYYTYYGISDIDDYMHKTNTGAVNETGNGDVTEVYLTDTNDIRLVTYRTYVYEVTNNYNSTSKSVNIIEAGDTNDFEDKAVKLNGNNLVGLNLQSRRLDEEDYPLVKNLKAGDRVLVNVAATSYSSAAQFEVKEVVAAPTVTGKVEGYRAESSEQVTIDGKTYKYSKTTMADGVKGKKYSVGQNATVALDLYDNVIDVMSALTSNDYVFIREFGANSNLNTVSTAYASAIFADGTSATIRIRDAVDYTNGGQEDNQNTIAGWGCISGYHKNGNNYDYNGNEGTYKQAGRFFTFTKNVNNEYILYTVEKNYFNAYDLGYGTTTGTKNAAAVEVLSSEQVFFIEPSSTDNTDANPKATWTNEKSVDQGVRDLDNLKANADTIVIIDDGANKLHRYVGVKNIPDLTLATGVNVAAHVYVSFKDNGYVNMAYVKICGDDASNSSNYTLSNNSDAHLVYVVSFDGADYSTTANTVWLYTIYNAKGEEETIRADSRIATSSDELYSFSHTEKNGDIYTKFTKVSSTNKGNGIVYAYNTTATKEAVAVDGGVVTFTGTVYDAAGQTTKAESYTVTDNAEIMLVVADKTCEGLNPKGSDSVAYAGLSLSQLGNYLKNYDIIYHAEAEADNSTDSNVLRKLYVTVTTATPSGTTSTSSTTINNTLRVTSDDVITENTTVNGNLIISNDATLNVYAKLTVTGYTSVAKGSELVIWKGGEFNSTGNVTISGEFVNQGGVNNSKGTFTVNNNSYYALEFDGTKSTDKFNKLVVNGIVDLSGSADTEITALAVNDGGNFTFNAKADTLKVDSVTNNGTITSSTGLTGEDAVEALEAGTKLTVTLNGVTPTEVTNATGTSSTYTRTDDTVEMKLTFANGTSLTVSSTYDVTVDANVVTFSKDAKGEYTVSKATA